MKMDGRRKNVLRCWLSSGIFFLFSFSFSKTVWIETNRYKTGPLRCSSNHIEKTDNTEQRAVKFSTRTGWRQSLLMVVLAESLLVFIPRGTDWWWRRNPSNWFLQETNQLAVWLTAHCCEAVNKDLFGKQNKMEEGGMNHLYFWNHKVNADPMEILLHIKILRYTFYTSLELSTWRAVRLLFVLGFSVLFFVVVFSCSVKWMGVERCNWALCKTPNCLIIQLCQIACLFINGRSYEIIRNQSKPVRTWRFSSKIKVDLTRGCKLRGPSVLPLWSCFFKTFSVYPFFFCLKNGRDKILILAAKAPLPQSWAAESPFALPLPSQTTSFRRKGDTVLSCTPPGVGRPEHG